ncbi:MAG: transmembrane anchor protein [Candidatus Latescibacteria bacterium]|nr:transmembrane anchor protein [Candidatus Latescibacterota bacterium]
MFNAHTPSPEDLPTSKQLVRSTILAICIAVVVLITAILPAEYGIDPTGIGSVLGLTAMGEIKVALAREAATHSAPIVNNTTITSPMPLIDLQVTESKPVKPIKTDFIEHTLAPGAAIEFKLEMKKDAVAQYKWSTVDGVLNHDTHGDGYRGTKQFISYKKGRMVTSDAGEIKAAFDGYHGWFWRNRDTVPVTFKLETSGDYIALKRMM